MEYGDIVVFKGEVGKVVGNVGDFRFLPAGYGNYREEDLHQITFDDIEAAFQEDKDTYIKKNFSWGRIVSFNTFGDFQFIEDTKGVFHVYIEHRDTNRGAYSLDAAILTGLAYKYDGCNSQAAKFMMLMLGIK